MKVKIIIISAVVICAIIFAYMLLDKIAVFALSKFYGINVSYTSLTKDRVNGYSFENLKLLNKRMGMGFFSARANLRLNKNSSILKSLDIDFKFKDVHFIRIRPESELGMYDSLNKLVAMPFEDRWAYKDVSGTVEIFSNGFTLKNFTASGNKIRLALEGDIYYNNTVDTRITIYFSKDVLKNIPPELYSVIMKNEPEEWKSFSVKVRGNYGSPSIQISGNLFRLNVSTVVMND